MKIQLEMFDKLKIASMSQDEKSLAVMTQGIHLFCKLFFFLQEPWQMFIAGKNAEKASALERRGKEK